MPAKKSKKAETVYEAVEQKDLKRLFELINAGADVNESEEDTPLSKAAELGRPLSEFIPGNGNESPDIIEA